MNRRSLGVAIEAVYAELTCRPKARVEWRTLSEPAIFREIAASILGGRVPFEMALAATNRLAAQGLLCFSGDEHAYRLRVHRALREPLFHPTWRRPRRYRFPAARSTALASTAARFYSCGGSIKTWLGQFPDSHSARRALVTTACGIGPKQASMILRNIGYSDELAILDSHLLHFMELEGIAALTATRLASVTGYEAAELTFLDYARKFGCAPAALDLAIWISMRVYTRGQA